MKAWPYIVIVALAILSGWLFNEWRRSKAEVHRKDSIIAEKNDSLRYERTESGRLRVEKAAAVASAEEFKEAYPRLVAELKDYEVEVKDLKAYVRAEFSAFGKVVGKIDTGTFKPDNLTLNPELHLSTFNRRAKLSDGYLSQELFWRDGSSDINGTYVYSDTLTYGFRTDKKWLLGKERLYGFGGLRNPNAKITKATNVLIDDYKDKRWVISVGVATNPFDGFKLYPTISAGYALFKF